MAISWEQCICRDPGSGVLMLLGLLLLVLRVYDFMDGSMLPPSDTQNAHRVYTSLAVQEGSR